MTTQPGSPKETSRKGVRLFLSWNLLLFCVGMAAYMASYYVMAEIGTQIGWREFDTRQLGVLFVIAVVLWAGETTFLNLLFRIAAMSVVVSFATQYGVGVSRCVNAETAPDVCLGISAVPVIAIPAAMILGLVAMFEVRKSREKFYAAFG